METTNKPRVAMVAWLTLLLTLVVVFFVVILASEDDNKDARDGKRNIYLRPWNGTSNSDDIHTNNNHNSHPEYDNFLLWSDEFDQDKLKDEFWSFSSPDCYYDDHSVSIQSDSLTIAKTEVMNAAVPFVSGSITSQNKVEFQYGTLQAKIKIVGESENHDFVPSFWTHGSGGQIDILEMLTSSIGTTTITTGARWMHKDDGSNVMESSSFHQDFDFVHDDELFHIYKLDWTPHRLATYVDDELIWQMDISSSSCNSCQDFHRPHSIGISLAVITTTEDVASSTTTKMEMVVDHVRLYDNGFSIASFDLP